MLKLQEFIKNHPDNFKELLAEKPYCIKVKEDEHFMLFKYSQIDSDFSNELVRECRGIILDKVDWSITCHPFHKFFNYMEDYAADIDWNSASILTKIDGSLIKYFFNKYTNSWQFATNGTIDANKAELLTPSGKTKTFLDLIYDTLEKMDIKKFVLDRMLIKDYTYLFEITSPENKIVIPYKEYTLTYLATKHNETGREIDQIIGFPKPKRYPLFSLEDCIKAAEKLPYNNEGYVVKDRFNNRIKIKGKEYIKRHRLKGEGVFTDKRAFDIIKLNEDKEFLSYFPEFEKNIFKIKDIYNKCKTYIDKKQKLLERSFFIDRKSYALFIKDWYFKDYFFKILDKKNISISFYLKKKTWKKIPSYFK